MSDSWGVRVRDARLERLWTQRDLAERAYLHINTIHRVETGLVDPSPLTQQRLAMALGVKRVELFS